LNIDPINGNVNISGRVAIGQNTITSGFALDVNGNIRCIALTQTSDYRIKDNVRPITNTIDNLRPLSYFNRLSGKEDMGFIAHELQEQFPSLVSGEKDDTDYQSVNYTGLIALLVKEIQDLKKEIKEIKSNMAILSLPPP
jgi:NADH/NAD ratio-sensing transcriptional regulator Rex